jgi:hypothetical protein
MAATKKRTIEQVKIDDPETPNEDYISLTTHADQFGSNPVRMDWGNPDPLKRGPVVATVKHGGQRNAIGAHGGFMESFLPHLFFSFFPFFRFITLDIYYFRRILYLHSFGGCLRWFESEPYP